MSLSNSIIHIDGSSDSSLNESSKDKRRRSTFYVALSANGSERSSDNYDNHFDQKLINDTYPRYKSTSNYKYHDKGVFLNDASSLSSQTSSDNAPGGRMRQQKFRCAPQGCSGNTTVVMILPDGDDFGDTDDEDGDMEVKTVNGKQILNRDKVVKSFYDNRTSLEEDGNGRFETNQGVKKDFITINKRKEFAPVTQKPKVAPRTILTSKCDPDRLLLRKTPSMSSVEATPKRKTIPGVLKSQSNHAVVSVRNPTPIKMRLSISKDQTSPITLTEKQKCKTLPAQQHLTPETPKSPSNKLGLSFVRRAHSAKLTRSNSFLKALATKCAGPSFCKDDDSSLVKSEVIPLNSDLLKEALSNGAGKVLAKAVNGIWVDNGANLGTTSTEDDEEDEAHSGNFFLLYLKQ